jgi:hypothetical protein
MSSDGGIIAYDTANSLSSNPVLGADGFTLVFESGASDLTGGVTRQLRKLLLVRLGSVDQCTSWSDHGNLLSRNWMISIPASRRRAWLDFPPCLWLLVDLPGSPTMGSVRSQACDRAIQSAGPVPPPTPLS